MKITIDYVAIDEKTLTLMLLLDEEQTMRIKSEILAKLGITVHKEEKPIDAYIRHLCHINGLEFTRPLQKELTTAIYSSREALKMLFALA